MLRFSWALPAAGFSAISFIPLSLHQSKGKTRIEIDSIETHWFYFGNWKFYSEKGKLTHIRKYNNGELISEQEIK